MTAPDWSTVVFDWPGDTPVGRPPLPWGSGRDEYSSGRKSAADRESAGRDDDLEPVAEISEA